jgi:hypothetical protein
MTQEEKAARAAERRADREILNRAYAVKRKHYALWAKMTPEERTEHDRKLHEELVAKGFRCVVSAR